MALSPGTRLGPYEIFSPLGAGGMGEVYRAKDHKLGRQVAIKVLPDELGSSRERLQRLLHRDGAGRGEDASADPPADQARTASA